jgi:hypothetical protein
VIVIPQLLYPATFAKRHASPQRPPDQGCSSLRQFSQFFLQDPEKLLKNSSSQPFQQ